MSSAERTGIRTRSLILSAFATAVVTLALLGAFLAMLLALADDRHAGAQPTPDIDTVAVDLDQTGNTATNIGTGGPGIDPGDIQSSVGNVAIGSSVPFDIVAWFPDNPARWLTRSGLATVLGEDAIHRAEWRGDPIRLYPTPKDWLHASHGGDNCAVCVVDWDADIRFLFTGLTVFCNADLERRIHDRLRDFSQPNLSPGLWSRSIR